MEIETKRSEARRGSCSEREDRASCLRVRSLVQFKVASTRFAVANRFSVETER